jgi:hypothetical protein
MTRGRWMLVAAAVVVLLVVLGQRWVERPQRLDPRVAVATDWPPLASHVEVEVLNAGGQSGAARDAALRLRRGGLDVVYWGNAGTEEVDSQPRQPRILVRRSDTGGIGRVQEILGAAEVVVMPDSVPLVDLTVLIWRDTTP